MRKVGEDNKAGWPVMARGLAASEAKSHLGELFLKRAETG